MSNSDDLEKNMMDRMAEEAKRLQHQYDLRTSLLTERLSIGLKQRTLIADVISGAISEKLQGDEETARALAKVIISALDVVGVGEDDMQGILDGTLHTCDGYCRDD